MRHPSPVAGTDRCAPLTYLRALDAFGFGFMLIPHPRCSPNLTPPPKQKSLCRKGLTSELRAARSEMFAAQSAQSQVTSWRCWRAPTRPSSALPTLSEMPTLPISVPRAFLVDDTLLVKESLQRSSGPSLSSCKRNGDRWVNSSERTWVNFRERQSHRQAVLPSNAGEFTHACRRDTVDPLNA